MFLLGCGQGGVPDPLLPLVAHSFALTAGQAGTGAGSSMCGPVYPSGTCGGDGLTSASFASVGASTLGALAAEAGLGAEACSAVVLPQPLTISKAGDCPLNGVSGPTRRHRWRGRS